MRIVGIGWLLLSCCAMGFSANAYAQTGAIAPETGTTTSASTDLATQKNEVDSAWRVRLYIENDSRWLKPNHPTDRWYTNGLLLSASHQPPKLQELLPHLPFAKAFENSAHDPNLPTSSAVGFHLGQLMFTPERLGIRTPQPDDHPYAGYLFVGGTLERANDITLDRLRVDIGMVGPSSLAEQTQKNFHHHVSGDKPRGWGYQVKDEPAIQTYLRKKWRLPLGQIALGADTGASTLSFQVIPETGIALGTVYRHVEAGVLLRAGFVIPDDFGPGTIANLASSTGSPTPQGWSGYAFGGITGRVSEHNATLGQSDFHGHNDVAVHAFPAVGQALGGLQVNYRKDRCNFGLMYAQTYSTHEFHGQRGTPAWGTLRVDFSLAF